jgi:hypothetical protein
LANRRKGYFTSPACCTSWQGNSIVLSANFFREGKKQLRFAKWFGDSPERTWQWIPTMFARIFFFGLSHVQQGLENGAKEPDGVIT